MLRFGFGKSVAAMLAYWGAISTMIMGQAVVCGADAEHVGRIVAVDSDVELGEGGVLEGQAVDSSGRPLAGATISLRSEGREVAVAVSDGGGQFRVSSLRGGVYEIVVGPTRGFYRLWGPRTAPPSARQAILLVACNEPIRGQQGPVGRWLGNPWFIGAAVGAAVAIPIAIHNQRIKRSVSP